MFLFEMKTVVHQSMKRVFNESYPIEEFRGISVSIDFPAEREHYPGIWCDFVPQTVRNVGIGHYELTDPDPDTGGRNKFYRWEGSGQISYTVYSISALEHARLHDEVVRVIAFSDPQAASPFRQYIMENDHVALDVAWESLDLSGYDSAPGTPWGTDEVVYEATIRLQTRFEFYSDPASTLVPLSKINVISFPEGTTDPAPDGDGLGDWV